jgi:uncharacterized protein YbjQ (UPF0145 family)
MLLVVFRVTALWTESVGQERIQLMLKPRLASLRGSNRRSPMRIFRHLGSLAFVLGLFTAVFVGIPWHVIVADDPVVPWWLRAAVFCLLGGILLVLLTVALEQWKDKASGKGELSAAPAGTVLLLNSAVVPDRKITRILGLVQGHTVYAIWLGNDLSAIVRLILGGELTEYTGMMGRARAAAANRMMAQASELGADAIINVRYMTTSVVGSAAELLVYGTAVKLDG